jgi:membrane protein YdbS with pleckstrin-like domain
VVYFFQMFPSFIENPTNISFSGQDTDETILLLLRAHPITNLKWIIPAIIVFFVPFFIPGFLTLLRVDLSALSSFYILSLIVINYLFVLVIIFEGFLGWYFNVYIVTTKNLVDIDFHSLLFNNIDLTPLRNVEDANSNQGGIFRSLFNFGDVYIRSAGTTALTDFLAVPNPHRVSDFIIDLAHKV